MSNFDSTCLAAQLRTHYSYDPDTGIFRRLTSLKRWKAGQVAGSLHATLGYVLIGFGGAQRYAHRLAFLYMTGSWPAGVVDHIDGVKHNNAWRNLRDVTQRVNVQNRRRAQIDSKTGVLGVVRRDGRFSAQLKHMGHAIPLGRFDTPEAAHEAYLLAKRKLHTGNTL